MQQYASPGLTSFTSPCGRHHLLDPADYSYTPVSLFFNEGAQSSTDLDLLGAVPQASPDSYTPPPLTIDSGASLITSTLPEGLILPQRRDVSFLEPTYEETNVDYHQNVPFEDFEPNYLDLTLRTPQQSLVDMEELKVSIPRAMAASLFCHLSPRMQYLLDYYDKHICSVLIAFDERCNPYRMHILQLATYNEGLQNALASLSLNNMRMRLYRRFPRTGIDVEINKEQHENNAIVARPSFEESYYKSLSIGHLQAQLADTSNAQDDSVLAILLILCLFHVCDSGFSKFKTQLEGVQKLLSMRGPGVRTGFIGWIEMSFAWFDVITSTVNDRETEIRGDRLETLHYSSDSGALEQLSGCDGRLFKLIARLGRLNLLSQNRPVRSDPRDSKSFYGATVTPNVKTEEVSSTSEIRRLRSQLESMGSSRLDDYGWDSLRADAPEGSYKVLREREKTRHDFWREWHDIRSRLETWSMEISYPLPIAFNPSGVSLKPEQQDLIHVNESFCSAALLYTERLAHPFLPSSSPKFQTHVRNTLSHITALWSTSCVNKSLLWPLFIAGTECVTAADQALIRDRCVDVQIKSGFFNSILVLDVLEKVWAENDKQNVHDADCVEVQRRIDSSKENEDCVQAFRWRKAMDRVDGEYLVI
ncbi:hypothetical protein KCV07_g9912, partial [Aureobasidium melanogenum]